MSPPLKSRDALRARQFFSPYCPAGGQWYVCSSGSKFVGCCESDPCSLDCAEGSLKAASFNPAAHGKFPDMRCPTGVSFWTCTGTSPPFWGCCKSNPCANRGCALGNLTQAYLKGIPEIDDQYLPSNSIWPSSTSSGTASSTPSARPGSSSSVTSVSSSATKTLSLETASATANSSSPVGAPSQNQSNIGLIAGLSVMGVVLGVGILLFLFWRRVKQLLTRRDHNNGGNSGHTGAGATLFNQPAMTTASHFNPITPPLTSPDARNSHMSSSYDGTTVAGQDSPTRFKRTSRHPHHHSIDTINTANTGGSGPYFSSASPHHGSPWVGFQDSPHMSYDMGAGGNTGVHSLHAVPAGGYDGRRDWQGRKPVPTGAPPHLQRQQEPAELAADPEAVEIGMRDSIRGREMRNVGNGNDIYNDNNDGQDRNAGQVPESSWYNPEAVARGNS